MANHSEFERARRAVIESSEDGSTLSSPFITLLPVTGAAISILAGGSMGQTTVSASDPIAARLDELQFDLGEGPCWDAMRKGHPVLASDFVHNGRQSWPAFGEAVESEAATAAVASVFAFPLSIGTLDIGAIDLYSTSPAVLAESDVAEASELADVVAWQVLRRLLGDQFDDKASYSRREVHQATGMIIAQLDVSPEEASLLLRAHAFAAGRSVREIATEVVARRLDFSADGRSNGPTVG